MADYEVHPHGQDPTSTSRLTAVSAASVDYQPARHGLDAEDIATIKALPATSALLISVAGPNMGARFLLNADSTTVGRHPKSDIFLDDVTVSRKHALLLRSGQDFFVRDSGSLNGTYVNMEQVEEAKLEDGDEVRIGKFQLTFYSAPKVS
ncbi:FHA domain-containing protein [Trueperella sp. LYQ143]|uniref:FHA domain-containing protein n=1 Tax=unclassified Trueperella TaxID=2630174 RepID=UPI003982F3D3